MGTDCSIVVFGSASDRAGTEALADLARHRVELLESLWSRFRPESELSRLNARAGQGDVVVSHETRVLVEAMVTAWRQTGGAFDPSVLHTMRALGYDRDFAEVIAESSIQGCTADVPGMDRVLLGLGSVSLPAGVGLDPGAIGKGLAADMVVEEIYGAGALGVLVDLGGDIALAGVPGAADGPNTVAGSGCQVRIPAEVGHAGVATSTSLKRRWGNSRHHVIDPATGSSAQEQLVQVTIAGPRAWECEVWATAVLVQPSLLPRVPSQLACLALSHHTTVRDDFAFADNPKKVA
jgi:thiamine biosynthesis lipoprotein